MRKPCYKGYWLVTNRCTLNCSYCVLENAPHQLKAELDLKGKKELISHLYYNLDFRRLTLSGGEVSVIGENPPTEFIKLLRHIRNFRSTDPSKNLEIELYSNGTLLDEEVVKEMAGVVDMVAVTIDGTKDEFFSEVGRNNVKFNNYYDNIIQVCNLLTKSNIALKLHSVVSMKNHLSLPGEVISILDAIEKKGGKASCWKFYQYMSYDMPVLDEAHELSIDMYKQFKERVGLALAERNLRLHFKDNKEMHASLFNILSYGNAQYMRTNDTWSTSKRTADLRTYNSMLDLFAKHDINETLFRRFHEIR